MAVQDRLLLILRQDSDGGESDDEGSIGMDAVLYELGQVELRSMDWEELCVYERMVLAGAAAVGSGADVVDRGIAAHGDVSADGGEIGLFAEDSRDDQAWAEGLGVGGTDRAASGIQRPELRTEFWADVAWMGGPADRSVDMTGGEAVGGEDNCGGADGGDAGAAITAMGSRADVMAAGSRAALTVLRAVSARCHTEGVVFNGGSMGSEWQQSGVGCGGDGGRAEAPSCFLAGVALAQGSCRDWDPILA